MKDKAGNILLIFAILEILSCTFFLFAGWKEVASILYLICGIGIAIIPLVSEKESAYVDSKRIYYYLLVLGILGISVYYFIGGSKLITHSKINPVYADMLPVIDTLSGRFIEGKPIYTPIEDLWQGFKPKYLPMMWLPFVPAKYLGIDIRWTTVFFLLVGILLGLKVFTPTKLNIRHVGLVILLFLPFWFIIHGDQNFVLLTQEGVIIFYYLLLGYALFTKNYYLQGIALAFCLLSRYAFTFWLPMYILFVFVFQNKKGAIKLVVTLLASILVILFVSGAYKELDTFAGLQGNYLRKITDPANQSNYRDVVYSGLGIAKFYGFKDLKYLHYIMLAVSAIVPFSLLLFAWWKRNQWNLAFFGICSLKLTLVCFYNLLPLPYLYLFYTSSFFTFIVLHRFLNRTVEIS